VNIVQDQSCVEEHDGPQLTRLCINRFQMLVVILYTKHQLQVALAYIIKLAFVQFYIMY
jgi:hypothetical protein